MVDIVKWRRRGGKMKEESGNELFGRIKMKRKFNKYFNGKRDKI